MESLFKRALQFSHDDMSPPVEFISEEVDFSILEMNALLSETN